MNQQLLRRFAVYAGIVLFFIALSFAFVAPQMEGKVLNQSDISQWQGMSHEVYEWNKTHPDDKTQWTGSMFGGMPTVGVIDDFEGDYTKWLYQALQGMGRPASYLFLALLGGFLLMLAFGVNTFLSVAGAIAIAFCSYNFQIIQVGHNAKMQAIAYAPWVLAALIFTYKTALGSYRKNGNSAQSGARTNPADGLLPAPAIRDVLAATVAGSVLFAFALSFQIKANHVQISYYLAIIILFYVLALLISLLVRKDKAGLRNFFLASALLLVMGGVGIATNANKLLPTYNYTQYTMRGGSELSSDSDTHNKTGLDLEYATQWSYGIEETPNLMVPNFRGGISRGMARDSETYRLLRKAGHPEYAAYFQEYWGPQPFTAGPMYLGAVCCFLFVLGLLLFKGKEKWWLLAATVLAVFLAWGNHFMAFTRLMFNYAPMYSKFRTVSMALSALQITVPLLGFLVLDKILKGEYERKTLTGKAWAAFGLTGGFCLLCWLLPSVAGSFLTDAEAGQPDGLLDALISDRKALLTKDAFRSLLFISLAFALLLWGTAKKTGGRNDAAPSGKRTAITIAAFCVLILVDLFSAGKRYLSEDDFVTKKNYQGQFAEREADRIIHRDTDPSFRVLDLSVNTFNDAFQSYHHKCIGGYSPVKLQRYQDLIDRYLSKEISRAGNVLSDVATLSEFEEKMPGLPIVSMLNGRYIIVQGDLRPAVNDQAFGNAWLVSSIREAASPDEEIALLASADLRHEAIIGQDFIGSLSFTSTSTVSGAEKHSTVSGRTEPDNYQKNLNTTDNIVLTSYAPNELHYAFKTDRPALAVFSEIYHPIGWKAQILYTPLSGPEAIGAINLSTAADSARTEPITTNPIAASLPLLRANWILRAAQLPAGEGEIVMRYEPEDYAIGEGISRASSILLYLLLALSLGWSGRQKIARKP